MNYLRTKFMLLGLFLLIISCDEEEGTLPEQVQISFENTSSQEYYQVTVFFRDEVFTFNNLQAGQSTEAFAINSFYVPESVKVTTEDGTFETRPGDYFILWVSREPGTTYVDQLSFDEDGQFRWNGY